MIINFLLLFINNAKGLDPSRVLVHEFDTTPQISTQQIRASWALQTQSNSSGTFSLLLHLEGFLMYTGTVKT